MIKKLVNKHRKRKYNKYISEVIRKFEDLEEDRYDMYFDLVISADGKTYGRMIDWYSYIIFHKVQNVWIDLTEYRLADEETTLLLNLL